MHPVVFGYLDAGTGAAVAALVASGAVGFRAALGNAKGRLRRKGQDPADTAPAPTATDDGPSAG